MEGVEVERGEAIGLSLTDVPLLKAKRSLHSNSWGKRLGTTEARDRRGASHKSSLLEKEV